MPWKNLSDQCQRRPCRLSFSGRSRREHIIGVSVRETIMETTTAALMVMANSRKRRPTMPDMKISGMNTPMRERLRETTVKPICLAPLSAAIMGRSPDSMKRTMFSIMTMASSTTKPVEMVRAMRERLSRLKPSRYMRPKVPTMASGRATLVMTVAQRVRRKRKMTMTTRPMVRRRVN